MAEADLGDEPLEAGTLDAESAGAAEILVDGCSATIRMRARIASPEMLPDAGSLPHLICFPPTFGGGGSDEAGKYGDAR